MSEPIEVFWSFRSPYSYLVTPDLLKLQSDYHVDIRLRVVLPIAIRSKGTLFSTENRKPAAYILMDSFRRADFLGLPIRWPKPDPVVQNFNTLQVEEEQPLIHQLSALGVEAERQGKGIEFAAVVSRLIFGGTEGWDKGDHLSLAAHGIDLSLEKMMKEIAVGTHQRTIEQNHEHLETVGHWGVPTMVVRDEPFFGQDRIDTLRWRLDKLGVPKR